MQRNIKIKMSSEGKMLSGFVNKYLNERGNFKTDVCQYTFGMDLPLPQTATTDESTLKATATTNSIKFPKTARKSTTDDSIMISQNNDNALMMNIID